MNPLIFAALSIALGIFLFLYVIFRRSALVLFSEISLAFVIALLLKKIGWASVAAYFALGLTAVLAYRMKNI